MSRAGSTPSLIRHRKAPLRRRIWMSRRLYLYILPTLLLLGTFSYVPAFSALYHSLFKWDPFGGSEWLGLANFRQLYVDLFTPLPSVTGAAWTSVQQIAWLVPGLLVAAFIFVELEKERRWHSARYVGGALWLAGLIVALVSFARSLGQESLRADPVALKHLLAGGIAVIGLAGLQLVLWLRHQATGKALWWRLLGASTAATIFFAIGMLIKLTTAGAANPILRPSCWNLVRVMAFGLTIGLLMPLLIAEILFHLRGDRSKYIYRVLFIIPMVVPGIVATLMWGFIYRTDDGVLNRLILLLQRPPVLLTAMGIGWFLVLYLTVMKVLLAKRRGASARAPGVVAVSLVALPVVLSVVWTVLRIGGWADSYASFAVQVVAGALGPLHQPLLQLSAILAFVVLVTVLMVRWLRSRRKRGESLWPAIVGLTVLGLLVANWLVGFVRQMDSGSAMDFVSYTCHKTGFAWLGSIEFVPRKWLGDQKIALYSIMMMGFPWIGTISMLIFYAGLQGIPTSVIESAKLDGATGLRRFFSIDFPLILGQFKLLLILGIIGGIQGFQNVLILTFGGPSDSTQMPGLRMYQEAFGYGKLGYGTAIGVGMFLVILAVTYVNMKYIRPSAEEARS